MWIEKTGNVYIADAGEFRLQVYWGLQHEHGYRGKVNDHVLKQVFMSADEAKWGCLRLAQRLQRLTATELDRLEIATKEGV